MFEFKKRTLPIATAKELEYLRSQAEIANQNKADIAFIAMMSSVDPYVGEDDSSEQV